jgi:light-harvesting protein B-800-850 alpha chain
MNQGRIWTVVKPTVGLPLFLGAIAVTSLIVHYAVLTHTTWFPAFMQGGQKKVAIETQSTSPAVASLSDSTKFN